MIPSLEARKLALAYEGGRPIVEGFDASIEPGRVTVLIGPNGCGKSTVLRALARLLEPRGGSVLIEGADIRDASQRRLARILGILPQRSGHPEGLRVIDLVRMARYPRLGPWEPLGTEDERAVEQALSRCGLEGLEGRYLDELSGGQRQRAWIALALAQETPILLLDEPTTYLDGAHQVEILSLLRTLNEETGLTLVLVLHELAQAASIAHQIIAMKEGRILAEGPPSELLEPGLLERLYDVPFELRAEREGAKALPVPKSRVALGGGFEAARGAPLLEARALEAGYGGSKAFGPLDASIGPGGLTAILGPNGCGKSTLLKTLCGLHPARAGRALLDGRDVGGIGGRMAARRRAFLSQDAECPQGLSVGELVGLGRFPHRQSLGRAGRGDREAVACALEALDLAPLARSEASRLSGGQRQRVSLAMALAQGSPLIALDEPTSFLDPGHQVELMDALWTLTRSGERTVVAVLHDEAQAMRYADRILRLA